MSEHPVTVGRVDGTGPKIGFPTIEEAERYVGTYLTEQNPKGVEAGDYYIDAPEEAQRGGGMNETETESYVEALAQSCGYDEEDLDGSVDSLIDYKNALEDTVYRIEEILKGSLGMTLSDFFGENERAPV